jgi:hypothetical protein
MGKTLRVTGVAEVQGGGFSAHLTPGAPHGINPQMLVLELAFTVTAESPERQLLEFVQPWNDDGIQYTEVEFVIVGDYQAPIPAPIPVDEVH